MQSMLLLAALSVPASAEDDARARAVYVFVQAQHAQKTALQCTCGDGCKCDGYQWDCKDPVCPNASNSIPGISDVAANDPSHEYRWVQGSDADQVHLYDGKHQIGTWRYDLNEYYKFNEDRGTWSFALKRPPKGAPDVPKREARAMLPVVITAQEQCVGNA